MSYTPLQQEGQDPTGQGQFPGAHEAPAPPPGSTGGEGAGEEGQGYAVAGAVPYAQPVQAVPLPQQQQQYPVQQFHLQPNYAPQQQFYAPQPPQFAPVQPQPPQQGEGYRGAPVAYPVIRAAPFAAGLPQGQPGHLQPGAWSDGLFDCFESMSIVLLSCCVTPYRWAQTAQRAGLYEFARALALYGVPWLIFVVLQLVWDATKAWYLIFPSLACWAVQVYLGSKARLRIRQHYGIPGTDADDCMLHTFCRPCAVAQEARHIDRDLAIPI